MRILAGSFALKRLHPAWSARRLALCVTVLISFGCASTTSGPRSGTSRDPIEAQALGSGQFSSLHQALQQLRPTWLYRLGGVYEDGFRVNGIEWLRATSPVGVQRIELLTCEEAMLRLPVPSCVSAQYIHVRHRVN